MDIKIPILVSDAVPTGCAFLVPPDVLDRAELTDDDLLNALLGVGDLTVEEAADRIGREVVLLKGIDGGQRNGT